MCLSNSTANMSVYHPLSTVPVASRLGRFKVSPIIHTAIRVRELVDAGHDIINLSIGEPDFPTPTVACEAANRAMHDQSVVGYPPISGTLALSKAIQQKFWRDNRLHYDTDQITIGNGVKQILYNALMASLEPGDEAIIIAPYWTTYGDLVALTGARAVPILCSHKNDFKLHPQQLEQAITPHTKWLIFNSPE